MTGLISDTAEYWKSKGVQVRQWLDDDGGRYAFRIRVQFHDDGDQQDFFVTARNGMRTPLGAMKKLAARAANTDALLVVRVGDEHGTPAFYVYDPLTLLERGDDNTADNSRQRKGEQWVDFHPQWGVDLWDYVHGTKTPAAPDDDLEPLPSDGTDTLTDGSGVTLDDYGG